MKKSTKSWLQSLASRIQKMKKLPKASKVLCIMNNLWHKFCIKYSAQRSKYDILIINRYYWLKVFNFNVITKYFFDCFVLVFSDCICIIYELYSIYLLYITSYEHNMFMVGLFLNYYDLLFVACTSEFLRCLVSVGEYLLPISTFSL